MIHRSPLNYIYLCIALTVDLVDKSTSKSYYKILQYRILHDVSLFMFHCIRIFRHNVRHIKLEILGEKSA